MKRKSSNSLVASFTLIATVTFVNQSVASPQITRTEVSDDTITIHGKGFGKKDQPAPILWAFGEDIKENGVPVSKERGVKLGSTVSVGKDPNNNIWSRGFGATYSSVSRSADITHTYRAENEGWVGWPHAFGGDNTHFSNKAYISWRVRTSGDINNYKVARVSNIEGEFQTGNDPFSTGEEVLIASADGTEKKGKVVHVDVANALMHLEVPGMRAADSVGGRVTGLKSKASATLDGDSLYQTSVAGKYLRSYETVNEGGTRAILTTNRWFAVQVDSSGKELRRGFETLTDSGYNSPDISKSSNWVLLESYLDLSGDYGSGSISMNNEKIKRFNNLYIADSKPKDSGPTVSNIGWEPSGGAEVINVALNFGEIYFDKTPQRVILSNEMYYEKVRDNQEFQYIEEWTSEKIVTRFRTGNFTKLDPLYIFVFDASNSPNSLGFCIRNCDNGTSPPSKINLGID